MPVAVPIHYAGRRFRAVHNSASGEVGGATVFTYHQQDDVVWATYQGGSIRRGQLLARADADGRLDMRYQHLNTDGTLMTGTCTTLPEVLPNGRLRLHETWQWTCGDRSHGTSVLEELSPEDA